MLWSRVFNVLFSGSCYKEQSLYLLLQFKPPVLTTLLPGVSLIWSFLCVSVVRLVSQQRYFWGRSVELWEPSNDLYNRWSAETTCTITSSGETGEQCDSLLLLLPVVWSAPLILSSLFTFLVSTIVPSVWGVVNRCFFLVCFIRARRVDAAGIWLRIPGGSMCVVRESVWHMTVTRSPCFPMRLCGNVQLGWHSCHHPSLCRCTQQWKHHLNPADATVGVSHGAERFSKW